MTTDQAEALLRTMQAIWRQQLREEEAIAWFSTLEKLDYEATMVAIALLQADQEFFPAHAQVINLARAEAGRRRQEREQAQRRLALSPDSVTPPEVALERIAELRKQLRGSTKIPEGPLSERERRIARNIPERFAWARPAWLNAEITKEREAKAAAEAAGGHEEALSAPEAPVGAIEAGSAGESP